MAGVLAWAEPPALPVDAPGEHFSLEAEAHGECATFAFGQPVVGTSYFYWYDIDTNAHNINHDGTDAMTTHAADMEGLSFRRAEWHRAQLEDIVDAGIDFLMPVYWGVPGCYDGWSFAGLPPLVEAHSALEAEGKHPPKIGLFYDTSILRANAYQEDGSNYHVDLTTDFGKRWFYVAMRDFFSLIPPSKWARVDGKPIVFLYAASFAKAQDPNQLEPVRRWFLEDFGCEPFLVKMRDWQGDADAVYQWGGAVSMQLDEHVAALGPGYDHSAVPGRTPLVVDREDGRTYIDRWTQLLRMNPETRPWMVHVETWNEWHEGTDIAASQEYGRQYIVLTRAFADLWRARQRLEPVGPYVKARQVTWWEGTGHGVEVYESAGDGFWEPVEMDGRKAVVTVENLVAPDSRYLYFDIDDGFAQAVDGGGVRICITYRDAGCENFALEYDSTDPDSGLVAGAFRFADVITLEGSGEWKTAAFDLVECNFANRANGGDFRLAIQGGEKALVVSEATVTQGGPDAAYVETFLEQRPPVAPVPSFATYATAERYDGLYMGESLAQAFAKVSNDSGGLAWGLSYRMQSLNEMYRAADDPKYLKAQLEAIRAVLAARDDRIGAELWTGKVAKAWGCDKYADRGRAVFAVHTGVITCPILDFLLLAKENVQVAAELGDEAQAIAADVTEALAFHDPQWRDGPGEGEGHYIGKDQEEVCEDRPLPGNRLSAMGHALWLSWKITGNETHRDRAIALGHYIKNRFTPSPDGGYFWPYWLPEEAVTAPASRESLSGEDTSHGGLTASFPMQLGLEGEVFLEDDMKRLANTVLLGFGRRDDGILFGNIIGTPDASPKYVSLPARWLVLAAYEPAIEERITAFYRNFVNQPGPLDLAILVRYLGEQE